MGDEIEDCDFALDHVLLAGALRLVDDLQRERLPAPFAHDLVHHREIAFKWNRQFYDSIELNFIIIRD